MKRKILKLSKRWRETSRPTRQETEFKFTLNSGATSTQTENNEMFIFGAILGINKADCDKEYAGQEKSFIRPSQEDKSHKAKQKIQPKKKNVRVDYYGRR